MKLLGTSQDMLKIYQIIMIKFNVKYCFGHGVNLTFFTKNREINNRSKLLKTSELN